ncbi:Outer membrane efflux protein [Bacteroides luti]|uniref:Outer membrane efflux protein n=1 Tax=Bacteroides luti TaxID=1297750 RepID=A0A1M5BEG0_9BACE|nr:TolC family protein [Bacteroides luti]SHF40820.1 Outer membrane efflux protein [Bacteroides luti]
MIRKIVSLLVFSIFFLVPIQAQESIANMVPEDYVNFKLPPLDSLFENAKKNPLIQIHDTKKEEELGLLSKEKKSWLKYFSVGTSYHYGIQAYTSGYSDSATPLYYQYNNNASSYYNVGGSISIPLDDLFDRKRRIKNQKLLIKESEYMKEQKFDELKQQIIDLYTTVLSNLSILKLKSEYMAFAKAQYQVAENEFINGKVDASSLSGRKRIQIEAASEYESIRAILNNSLLKLEMLSRTSIINKK